VVVENIPVSQMELHFKITEQKIKDLEHIKTYYHKRFVVTSALNIC